MRLGFCILDGICLAVLAVMTIVFIVLHRNSVHKKQQMKDSLTNNYVESMFDNGEGETRK